MALSYSPLACSAIRHRGSTLCYQLLSFLSRKSEKSIYTDILSFFHSFNMALSKVSIEDVSELVPRFQILGKTNPLILAEALKQCGVSTLDHLRKFISIVEDHDYIPVVKKKREKDDLHVEKLSPAEKAQAGFNKLKMFADKLKSCTLIKIDCDLKIGIDYSQMSIEDMQKLFINELMPTQENNQIHRNLIDYEFGSFYLAFKSKFQNSDEYNKYLIEHEHLAYSSTMRLIKYFKICKEYPGFLFINISFVQIVELWKPLIELIKKDDEVSLLISSCPGEIVFNGRRVKIPYGRMNEDLDDEMWNQHSAGERHRLQSNHSSQSHPGSRSHSGSSSNHGTGEHHGSGSNHGTGEHHGSGEHLGSRSHPGSSSNHSSLGHHSSTSNLGSSSNHSSRGRLGSRGNLGSSTNRSSRGHLSSSSNHSSRGRLGSRGHHSSRGDLSSSSNHSSRGCHGSQNQHSAGEHHVLSNQSQDSDENHHGARRYDSSTDSTDGVAIDFDSLSVREEKNIPQARLD